MRGLPAGRAAELQPRLHRQTYPHREAVAVTHRQKSHHEKKMTSLRYAIEEGVLMAVAKTPVRAVPRVHQATVEYARVPISRQSAAYETWELIIDLWRQWARQSDRHWGRGVLSVQADKSFGALGLDII